MSNARLLAQHATMPLGFRNKIINGRMSVDQRRQGVVQNTAVANAQPIIGSFVADRWLVNVSLSNRVNFLKEPTVSIPGCKFAAFLASNSTAAIGTGDFARMIQTIEGNDIADLEFGGATAKPVTLSFWAHATVGGQYCVVLQNGGATRSYPATFTLPTNSWTFVLLTVPGCTDGTWDAAENGGLYVQFPIGCGSQYAGTPNVWSNANLVSATGCVNLLTTSGALRIAKVQLEAGSFATPFEFRPQEVESMLCRRWYQRRGDPGSNFALGRLTQQGQIIGYDFTPMRATPYVRAITDNNDGGSVEYNSIGHPSALADMTQSSLTFCPGTFSGFIDLKFIDMSCEI